MISNESLLIPLCYINNFFNTKRIKRMINNSSVRHAENIKVGRYDNNNPTQLPNLTIDVVIKRLFVSTRWIEDMCYLKEKKRGHHIG